MTTPNEKCRRMKRRRRRFLSGDFDLSGPENLRISIEGELNTGCFR